MKRCGASALNVRAHQRRGDPPARQTPPEARRSRGQDRPGPLRSSGTLLELIGNGESREMIVMLELATGRQNLPSRSTQADRTRLTGRLMNHGDLTRESRRCGEDRILFAAIPRLSCRYEESHFESGRSNSNGRSARIISGYSFGGKYPNSDSNSRSIRASVSA